MLPVLHPDAAGIDIGAEEIFVAVPAGSRTTDSVRSIRDVHARPARIGRLAAVSAESGPWQWSPLACTGSRFFRFWKRAGFEVFLVNAQHVKNVPGRKSDVSDCQWIQYLHSVGLLKASFRPPDEICVIRSLWRHRESLVQMAAEHIHAYAEGPQPDESAVAPCA